MKKILIVLIIIALVSCTIDTNIVFSSGVSIDVTDLQMENIPYEQTINNSIIDFKGEDRIVTDTPTQGPATANMFFQILNIIPATCGKLLSAAIREDYEEGETADDIFTIEGTVFNRFNLFDVNFTKFKYIGQDDEQQEQTQQPEQGNQTEAKETINTVIKKNVLSLYNGIRNLTIVIMLLILIYVGIRMILASTANEKAGYKKMLIDWFTGLVLLFLLHYIITIAVNVSGMITEILDPTEGSVIAAPNFEKQLFFGTDLAVAKIKLQNRTLVMRTGILNSLATENGWNLAFTSIIFWALIYYQMKFFFLYLKRFLTVGFLIVIAPLVTVTYSIDVLGDGKAQAFKAWLKEFLVNIFINPIHAVLYLIFMISAYEIAMVSPIFAVIFLMGLSRGEKIVKEMFGIRGLSTIHSMSESFKMKKR